MGSPLGKDFEAPISPWNGRGADREHPSLMGSARPSGQRLFDQISEFYAWYLSWDISPKVHAKTFEFLSRIMRIAQVSKDWGHFLSDEEEQKALKLLSSLREELFDGLCRQQEIPQTLLNILQLLTNSNPKARLVARTNELEYILCVNAAPSQPPEIRTRYQLLLDHILNQITPNLRDTHAHAVSQGLSKIIENPNAIADIHAAILQATQRWL